MTRNDMQSEINACKSLLNDTDYNVLKIAEGLFACDSAIDLIAYLKGIGEDIRQTIAKRTQWRATINELEAQLEQMPPEEYEPEQPIPEEKDEPELPIEEEEEPPVVHADEEEGIE